MNARLPTTDAATSPPAPPQPTPSVVIGRQDALNVISADGLPIRPGLYRVVWANRASDNAFLLRFPDAREQEEQEVSTGNKRTKLRLHMPTHASLLALEALAENAGW